MSDAVKNTQKIGIMKEVTEGTYLAPSGVTKFLAVLGDGAQLTPSKDLKERNVMTGSIGKVTPRTGMKSVGGTVPTEARTSGTPGQEPQYGPLMEAALGAVRSNTTVITTKASGNTASILQIEDADISKLAIGDSVLVKQSGAFHVSPITAKSSGAGTATVTMLVPHPSGDCTDSVTIEKLVTYYTANSGHPTLSISKYVEDARLESASGVRVKSLELNNFATGELADLKFALEGLTFDQSLTAPPFSPTFDSALPPIVLSAVVYMDGVAVPVNELSFSLENTLAFKTSTASANGKISSRVTERKVSGSFNPYKQSDSIANYTKFNSNTEFSVFGYMANPTGTAGEFSGVVALYLPKCIITELGEADQDGLLQETISFTASRGSDGASEELYITLI
jgi:hypothetical protein